MQRCFTQVWIIKEFDNSMEVAIEATILAQKSIAIKSGSR